MPKKVLSQIALELFEACANLTLTGCPSVRVRYSKEILTLYNKGYTLFSIVVLVIIALRIKITH